MQFPLIKDKTIIKIQKRNMKNSIAKVSKEKAIDVLGFQTRIKNELIESNLKKKSLFVNNKSHRFFIVPRKF